MNDVHYIIPGIPPPIGGIPPPPAFSSLISTKAHSVVRIIPATEAAFSNAIRVPVPNGSLAILHLQVESQTSIEGVNSVLKKYALEGDLVEQIKFSIDNELVSSDIIGSSAPAIYDSKATIVANHGKNIVLYIWYDNEYGYSHQVIRLAKYIAKVRRYTYY